MAPSGIALMIDKAESMEDVNDQRQIFLDKEHEIWEIIAAWLNLYGDMLDDSLKGYALPEEIEMNIKFHDAPVVVSEQEKLQNFKLRKELGLDSMLDLIMKDNPSLTKQEAEEKLKSLLEDKMMNAMNQNLESANKENEMSKPDDMEDMSENGSQEDNSKQE